MLEGCDLGARDDEGFVGGDDGHGCVVLPRGDAGDDAVVLGFQIPGAVVVRDDGVGVDDVLQKVIEVAAVAAGDVGTDLAAGVEEGVALLAGAGVNGASTGSVAGRAGGDHLLIAGNGFELVGLGLAHGAPEFADLLVHGGVLELAQLPHDIGGEILRGNLLLRNGDEQGAGGGDAGDEGVERILLLGGGEAGIGVENQRGGLRIVVGGESAQRAGAHDFVLEQGLEDAGDGGVFRGEEAFEGEEAGLRIGLRIGERFLEGVEGLRAAEGDGEGLGKFAHLRIGTLEQLGGEGFPAGGHLHITPSAEAFLHAAEKIDLELRVVIGGEQFDEGRQCIVLSPDGGRGEAQAGEDDAGPEARCHGWSLARRRGWCPMSNKHRSRARPAFGHCKFSIGDLGLNKRSRAQPLRLPGATRQPIGQCPPAVAREASPPVGRSSCDSCYKVLFVRAASAASVASTSALTASPFMQRKSMGHSRRKQGEHGASDFTS